jgi:hypothetical protein
MVSRIGAIRQWIAKSDGGNPNWRMYTSQVQEHVDLIIASLQFIHCVVTAERRCLLYYSGLAIRLDVFASIRKSSPTLINSGILYAAIRPQASKFASIGITIEAGALGKGEPSAWPLVQPGRGQNGKGKSPDH